MKEIKRREEVERFLKQFLPKLDIWGIIFIDREKNDAALRAMGITPMARETVIRSIETDDYVETMNDGTICRNEESIYRWTCKGGLYDGSTGVP